MPLFLSSTIEASPTIPPYMTLPVAAIPEVDVRVDAMLCNVLDRLHKLKPAWEFCVSHSTRLERPNGGAAFTLCYGVRVTAGGEVLGNISTSWLYSKRARRTTAHIDVECHRIHTHRGTANRFRTYREDAAVKLITSKMYELKLDEIGKRAVAEARGSLGQAHGGSNQTVRDWYNRISLDNRIEFLLDHKEAYLQKYTSQHVAEAVRSLQETATNAAIVTGVVAAPRVIISTLSKAVYVFGDNGECLLQDTSGGRHLPLCLRERLGLLKLVEDNQTVLNVGHRVSSGVFIVVVSEAELADIRKEQS